MRDRIRLIMESEHLTPSAFADRLQLGRAVVSHILNGRNNPSLDVVTRILSKMNYINPDWLISGNGDMYKTDSGKTHTSQNSTLSNSSQQDLFAQTTISLPSALQEDEYLKESEVKQPKNEIENNVNQQIIYQKTPDRKIAKIIIYYSDNTFETFNADNRPL